MELKVSSYEKVTGIFVIEPAGKIDITTCDTLEQEVERVMENFPKSIVFDMQDVDYISSAGIRVILKAHKGMKQRGWEVSMTNLQPTVRKVFEIIKALPDQQIFSNVEELDAYLDRIQKSGN